MQLPRVMMLLSVRETQVLAFVAEGKTTKEIGGELGIADSTVNWHIANVLAKLEASSRAEAVAAAARNGLLPSAASDDVVKPQDVVEARDVDVVPPRGRFETRTTRVADVAVLGLSLASVTVETRVVRRD